MSLDHHCSSCRQHQQHFHESTDLVDSLAQHMVWTSPYCCKNNKKLSYCRVTSDHAISIDISSTAAWQCEKSCLKNLQYIYDLEGHSSQSARQAKSMGVRNFRTPVARKTPWPILTKFVTSDSVVDPTTHAKLGFQGSNGSVPTYWWNTHPWCLFFLSTLCLKKVPTF